MYYLMYYYEKKFKLVRGQSGGKTVKFPESTPMKQFLKNTHDQSVYYICIYPIKFDFERGSGTENHEFYYFINYTHGFWIFIT